MIPRKILSSFVLQSEAVAPQPGRGVVQKSRQPKLQRSAAKAVATSDLATFATSFFSAAEAKGDEGDPRRAFARIPLLPWRLGEMLPAEFEWASRRNAKGLSARGGVLNNQGGYSTHLA